MKIALFSWSSDEIRAIRLLELGSGEREKKLKLLNYLEVDVIKMTEVFRRIRMSMRVGFYDFLRMTTRINL